MMKSYFKRSAAKERALGKVLAPRSRWSSTASIGVVVVLFGVLATTLGCCPETPEPPQPPQKPEATTEFEDYVGETTDVELDNGVIGPPPRIKAKTVERGQVIQFNATANTVWVLIPSPYFSRAGGGSDWAIGDDFIAFKIDHGIAKVRLSESFPSSEENSTVYYSILFFDGKDYNYQEGESPPRMIIPPSGPGG